jgi:type IV pilus assembly protein PilC
MFEAKKATLKELALFCRQFSTMISAGLTIVGAMNVLVMQTTNMKFRAVLTDVVQSLQEGLMLSKSMRKHAGTFPEIMISMIEAGETGGILDMVLERLAMQFEKQHKFNSKIRSAMAYPIVVSSVAIVVVGFLGMFVFPKFVDMFKSMNMKTPWMTQALIDLIAFIETYYWAIGILLVTGFFTFRYYNEKDEFRLQRNLLELKIPVVGALIQKTAMVNFTRTIGSLLRGGVPMMIALEVTGKTSANMLMKKAIANASNSVKNGKGFSETFGSSPVFLPMAVQMMMIGEQSGMLDAMLDRIADYYEVEIDETVSKLSTIIEPIMIVGLGIGATLVVITVIVPMMEAVTGVGK